MKIQELDRINALAQKAKTEGLTEQEIQERDELRKIYLRKIRGQVSTLMASVSVHDEQGNDITPAGLYYAKKAGIPSADSILQNDQDGTTDNHTN